ncbi:AIR synthase family protein [Halobacterium salinarum]|uniref:AIR synthase family protein n=1 Tax=Halobacterium salinarum TaxID=2242 RepID=UPI001F1D52F6|nr:AIR synthase family protein [Halobacterium salinarum]MCF2164961.1 AIR synthase family protein [Halobacterium salinarum]MCF2168460.1 AIR synthase family protein [Halobacterium salinarum]MCF2237672.1 AIR synthase family protein [Halobacterium salinarum]
MTSQIGKIDAEFFAQHLSPNLGADDDAVTVGPQYGVDFGVLSIGGQRLVVSADPVSVNPGVGIKRAGRLALHSVLSDVAVSGVPPSFLSITLVLPASARDDTIAALWDAMATECERLGVSVVTGHTARQDVSFPWIGGATAMGVGDPDEIVRPDGATAGDTVLMTHSPGAEVAGLFAALFGGHLDVADGTVERADARLEDTTVVGDACAAASAPVTAMHDATECGIQGALVELATAAGVSISVSSDAVPVPEDVSAVCADLGLDPWQVSSRGTLLVTVPEAHADTAMAALDARNTPVAAIGTVSEGSGVTVDGTQVVHPGSDPAWTVFSALQRDAAARSP